MKYFIPTMKYLFLAISIISYFLIILAGDMIGLPFICWLLFVSFDFGNIDQLFAILGVFGVVINLTRWINNIQITIVSFILMLSPIVSRLVQVPLEKFDYLAFEIPLTVFIVAYLAFIVLNIIHRNTADNSNGGSEIPTASI